MRPLLSVAPMMGWTDRHYRFLMRLISPDVLLYTEMITAAALVYGDRERLLAFHPEEHPVACQLGGSDPEELAQAARYVTSAGYDEINLNVGCPSPRTQKGSIGACLMKDPQRVAACLWALAENTSLPVTLKTRIGVDDMEGYEALFNFITRVTEAPCRVIIVHARKALLKGLNPKQNRTVPPLRYEYVYRLKKERPDLTVVLNGGVQSLEEVDTHTQHLDGCMVGRAAYHDPYSWSRFSRRAPLPREEIVRSFLLYLDQQKVPPHKGGRHLMGLYRGQPYGQCFRRAVSQGDLQEWLCVHA